MVTGMIGATLLTLAEESLNRILAQDPVTLQRLATLSGREIAVHCTAPEFQVYLLPHAQGIDLLGQSATAADVTLHGSALNLMRLPSAGNAVLFGQGVRIEGDSGLAHTLQQILADSQIDWEAWLGNLIGDTAAHPLAQLMRNTGQQLQRTGSSLMHSLEEYLHEEARLLPTRVEIEIAQDEGDALRAATDRLDARISRLERLRASAKD